MTDEELNEIESRASAATPGQWTAGEIGVVTTDAKISERYDQVASVLPICDRKGYCYQDGTTRFIAHARADIPALIAEVRRLKAETEKNRRVFVWAKHRDEDGDFFSLPISDTLVFQLYQDGICPLELREPTEQELLWCWDIPEPTFDAAEQLIRELGFARDGDVFDRSKVTP